MKKILSGFLIMTFVINIFGVTALFAAPIENQTNNDSITLIRAFDTNDNTKIIADNNEITSYDSLNMVALNDEELNEVQGTFWWAVVYWVAKRVVVTAAYYATGIGPLSAVPCY